MSVYKRGGVYWFSLVWDGRRVQRSTRQGDRRAAVQIEAAHRTALAKGAAGLREKKPAPMLGAFAEKRFLPWVEAEFAAKPKTRHFYRNGARRLKEYAPLAALCLDDQHLTEQVGGYVASRQAKGLTTASINRELQVLRRLLHLASEWGVLEQCPKVKMLTGEHHRDFVLTLEEEARYLATAPEPLASVAAVLADTGMRPEELLRLQWQHVNWVNGRHGTVFVAQGKTAAARRLLPMTPRVRGILELRWEALGQPVEGWVWSAPTRSGHLEPSSLRKGHARALKRSKVRRFVLYSFRHTFLTRLGESGCDAWTLARIAGHSNIAISARYVHPSDDSVLAAMEKLPGRRPPLQIPLHSESGDLEPEGAIAVSS